MTLKRLLSKLLPAILLFTSTGTASAQTDTISVATDSLTLVTCNDSITEDQRKFQNYEKRTNWYKSTVGSIDSEPILPAICRRHRNGFCRHWLVLRKTRTMGNACIPRLSPEEPHTVILLVIHCQAGVHPVESAGGKEIDCRTTLRYILHQLNSQ